MCRKISVTYVLVGVLAALTAFRSTDARPTDTRQNDRYSIVAQSTTETAATGRRPIGRRIAASNLPLQVPAIASPAEAPQVQAAAVAETPEPDEAESDQTGTISADETAAPVAEQLSEQVEDESPEPAVVLETETEIPSAKVPLVRVPVEPQPQPYRVPRDTLLRRVQEAMGKRVQPAPAGAEIAALPGVMTADRDGPTVSSTPEPARLEFDVRESRSIVGEGEQLVMRIAVRNIGGKPAEKVTATLFFAEGIEPVQAIGHTAEVYPGEVRFEAVAHLPPGESVDLLVTAVGTRPGNVAYRGELECRQPSGRVAHEGAVTVRARRVTEP